MSQGIPKEALRALCQAVGHPTRLRILKLLAERRHTVGELVRRLELEQPTVSKHLATLLKAGLVRFQVDGRCRCYTLAQGDPVRRLLASFEAVVQQVQANDSGE